MFCRPGFSRSMHVRMYAVYVLSFWILSVKYSGLVKCWRWTVSRVKLVLLELHHAYCNFRAAGHLRAKKQSWNLIPIMLLACHLRQEDHGVANIQLVFPWSSLLIEAILAAAYWGNSCRWGGFRTTGLTNFMIFAARKGDTWETCTAGDILHTCTSGDV